MTVKETRIEWGQPKKTTTVSPGTTIVLDNTESFVNGEPINYNGTPLKTRLLSVPKDQIYVLDPDTIVQTSVTPAWKDGKDRPVSPKLKKTTYRKNAINKAKLTARGENPNETTLFTWEGEKPQKNNTPS